MRKALLLFVTAILMLTSTSVGAQQKVWDETESQKEERMKWWTNDRFGMFVHWGIYALPARHEWVQTNERIPFEEYPFGVVQETNSAVPQSYEFC